jgi:hypothetical protein
MTNGAWLAMATLLGACAAPAVANQPTTMPVAGGPEGHEDALELRLLAMAQTLREQGFARGQFQDRGFLAANGRATRPVSIAPRSCVRFVAVATPSVIDLDASLYRADGSALLEDDGSDARPSLTLCAGDKRVEGYYSIHAYQGVGAFVTADFVRPALPGDDLLTAQENGAESALNELAKTLHKRGFEDAGPRVELHLESGQPMRVAISAKPGDCYTLATESSSALQGVTLRLLAGQEELANGVGSEDLASLQFCSDRARELALEVAAVSGQGTVRVARFRAPQGAVGGPHAMWLGEPSPSASAWHGAAKSSAAARAEPTLVGKTVFVEERALEQGAVLEIERKRPGQVCELWQAVLHPGLSRATLRLEGVEGTFYGETESEDMVARLLVCGRKGPARVIVVGRAGFGSLTLSASETSERPPLL